MTWVWLSLAAAFLQNVRTATQRRLGSSLSTAGSASVRFLFGLPFAALWLVWLLRDGGAVPSPGASFAAFAVVGSIAQIAGTALLLAAFRHRSFAIGQTYSKTEGIQTVIVGYLLLGDRVSPGALIGIVLTVAGVMVVSFARHAPHAASGPTADTVADRRRHRHAAAWLGLGSGAAFALSAVGYRGAAQSLGDQDFVLRAAFTLVVALAVQSALCLAWLVVREPGELGRIVQVKRVAALAGLTGAAASACWFTAFTLVAAAYVKAVGSVELLFAIVTSWALFGERPTGGELLGMALVAIGVALTVLAGR